MAPAGNNEGISNMTDTKNFATDRNHTLTKANEAAKLAVFDAFSKAGITFVTVFLKAENGRGHIEEITLYKGDEIEEMPDAVVTEQLQALETLCFDCLWQAQGGWENGGSAQGDFMFHVPQCRIEIGFYARFTDPNHPHTF
jgi:hypothetical protein